MYPQAIRKLQSCKSSSFIGSEAYHHCLAEMALHLRQTHCIQDFLDSATVKIRTLLSADRVLLYRLSSIGKGVVIAKSVSSTYPLIAKQSTCNLYFDRDWRFFYELGHIEVTSDINTNGLNPRYTKFLRQFQVRANLVVPLLKKPIPDIAVSSEQLLDQRHPQSANVWGLLVVQQCSTPREWHTSEIEFVDQMASQVEIALYQSDLYAIAQRETIQRRFFETAIPTSQDMGYEILPDPLEVRTEEERLRQVGLRNRRKEWELYPEAEQAQLTLEAMGDGIITTDKQGNIQYLNPVAEHLTGWNFSEVKGLHIVDVLKLINELTRQPVENPVIKSLQTGQSNSLGSNTLMISRNGIEYPVENSTSPIRKANGEMIGAVTIFHDATQSRSITQQLSWQANHDELTGLCNRGAFKRQLTNALEDSQSQKQSHALCYLDLDHFKEINDTCGQAIGDQLLCQIVDLLRKQMPATDLLARLGGDKFGLLLHRCTLEQAKVIANNLRTLLQNFQFTWNNQVFNLSMSIGLVAINPTNASVDTLLHKADVACHVAKQKGRNCLHVYQPKDQRVTQRYPETQWISLIEDALNKNQFQLYHQTITSLAHDRTTKRSEVLLRLLDKAGNMIPPSLFIPVAERYCSISKIDKWVVKTFCENYRNLAQHDIEKHEFQEPVSRIYNINLSRASVNDDTFLATLHLLLAQYSIPPESICFEITESVALANMDKASKLMSGVKKLGCSSALDNFGSGMGSFAYLKALPFDYLKIDGRYVKDLASDHIDYAMVNCFNTLSHFLGIQTIAERVETASALKTLQAIGVDYAQGFCISKPRPLLISQYV